MHLLMWIFNLIFRHAQSLQFLRDIFPRVIGRSRNLPLSIIKTRQHNDIFVEKEEIFLSQRNTFIFSDIEKYFVCLITFLFFKFFLPINILLSIQPSADSFL